MADYICHTGDTFRSADLGIWERNLCKNRAWIFNCALFALLFIRKVIPPFTKRQQILAFYLWFSVGSIWRRVWFERTAFSRLRKFKKMERKTFQGKQGRRIKILSSQ